jgi:hypothetical protein
MGDAPVGVDAGDGGDRGDRQHRPHEQTDDDRNGDKGNPEVTPGPYDHEVTSRPGRWTATEAGDVVDQAGHGRRPPRVCTDAGAGAAAPGASARTERIASGRTPSWWVSA